ncbi:YheC/YheD family protein [Evansella sp. AB-P1]|uniref:YheC/YheD family endospore coat-associated protein n=1 Tax=Evansella sp. AB-P1 TaxID=3037653 RepID=UPI00241F1D65|nr:YheC/YheD family protein [Evansella sp. AB-P1]MDG5786384.1 YheC/YheD family protein [Evansella sp. AB-P1]
MPHMVEIKQLESNDHAYKLFISNNYLSEWNIQEGTEKNVQFGTKEVTCTVHSKEDITNDTCFLSNRAWNKLCIPYPIKLSIEYDNVERIFIGPIIGIYTAGFTGSILRPVGERSFLFAKYLHAARTTGALAIIFGSHHIDWENETMEGYSFQETGWKKIKVPIPNVVYDRLPNRRTEMHPTYSEIKERLQKNYQIPWFNPGFFDKSHIYEQLINLSDVNKYLPTTITSPTDKEIKSFINQYKHVYIKPKNGSLGMGIHQVLFDDKENYYYCRFRDHIRNRLRRYGSLTRLLQNQFPNGFDQMVVQQGISLLKYQNNPIDFRVHTNKDEMGKWRISAIAAKIAGSGSVTTHVKSGGHIKSINEIWEDLKLRKSLLEELKTTALHLTYAIDKTTDGIVGEIGFDIGIDQNEDIWMFEANSKPGRTIFSHPKLKQEDQLTRKLPMNYANYLYKEAIMDYSANDEVTI